MHSFTSAVKFLISHEIYNFLKGTIREGFKKNKKKVVILLQPLSVYLPTPIGVQKANFLMFFACFEKTIFDEKNFLVTSEHNYNYNYA